mmetsp:Transcript_103695/g.299931  ORF Transcript_103695/g.299931 Transcript_103695/m.299931 type:complete len:338 (-) Transcript_103695:38-1051(-)|eukprot:CAMPEP_0176023202 /NCGR_PEP_ID=MMETSP0120_2-20121206/11313_1 /TAXON_ID=160619 /ORGANISM="Kryptoperidinium foliaceum, Strain CCMP 1326" /LENGTH=337 /DNA_ID=CAMNT_0017356359 /DNA_START=107 /DNA_END=1120 /DNA_ORIENTATION=-
MASRNPRVQSSNGEPETKRRRTSGRAKKPRDFLSVSHSSERSYTTNKPEVVLKNECFEDSGKVGRKAWRDHGIGGTRTLVKFNHTLEPWGFCPKWIGRTLDVKKLGTAGVHYAAGYPQLGEMVQRLGDDFSKWPCLPGFEDRRPVPAPSQQDQQRVPEAKVPDCDGAETVFSDDETVEMSAVPNADKFSVFSVDSTDQVAAATPAPAADHRTRTTTVPSRTPGIQANGTASRQVSPPVPLNQVSIDEVAAQREAEETSAAGVSHTSDAPAPGNDTMDDRLKAIELEKKELALNQAKQDARLADLERYERLREKGLSHRKIRRLFPQLAEFLSDDEEV